MIVVGTLAIWILPKKFTFTQSLFNLLIGVVFGLMFDHTIAVPPFDLYDVGIEWLSVLVGIFHYKHGYQLVYSIPIYLFLQSIHLLLYRMFFPERKTIA